MKNDASLCSYRILSYSLVGTFFVFVDNEYYSFVFDYPIFPVDSRRNKTPSS